MEGTIRRLHDLGFAVDEVALQPTGAGETNLRLRVAVGDRRYHAAHLRGLTGLDVGEGQARILLGDLHAYQVHLCRESGEDVGEPTAAQLWLREVALPGMDRAHSAVHRSGTAIQAYCDLLEVRWLLSEQAGHDVGTEKAVAALSLSGLSSTTRGSRVDDAGPPVRSRSRHQSLTLRKKGRLLWGRKTFAP